MNNVSRAVSPFALLAPFTLEKSLNFGLWSWIGFNAFIVMMLVLDLGVFHRKSHRVSVREATIWTSVWIALALAFCGLIYFRAGGELALLFLTGYVLEKSLSVDNVFVMVLIFSYFRVPAQYQHRVLFWGVLGALVMRGIFIGVGAYVLHHWHPVIYIFGALLLVTGVRMVVKTEEEPDLGHNPIVRLVRRLIPISHEYHGQSFIVREAGRLIATPLFLVLVLIEASDVVFAVDSIPAIFAITDNPFIVYTSNVFAILGLRSMYLMLGDVVHRFAYIKYGLAIVLVFIGLKMMLIDFVKVPTSWSLAIIALLIGGSIGYSVYRSRKSGPAPKETKPDDEAFVA